MTEFELIKRYFHRPKESALLGNGDDCAVIVPRAGFAFAVTTDTMIEGRHFLPNLAPEKLGHRVAMVNFSDLAAMGALPRYAMLSLCLPSATEAWLGAFSRGLWSALDRYGVELVGGNTTRAAQGALSVALTAFGELPPAEALTRSGAQVGDDVWVSGTLGGAGFGLHYLLGDANCNKGALHLSAEVIQRCIQQYEEPTARIALGLSLRGVAKSAIDISDGLLSEAMHIAEASNVHVQIDFDAIPTALKPLLNKRSGDDWLFAQRCILNMGDAYELLFTAPTNLREQVQTCLAQHAPDGARIGRVLPVSAAHRHAVSVLDAQSTLIDIDVKGWDHFAPKPD